MSKKPDIRSFWNPQPRLGEATQKAMLTGELYGPKERDALIRSIRAGTIVEVAEGYVLAKAKAKATGRADSRKRDWLKTVDDVEARGGILVETRTGRRSDKAKDWRAVQAEAFHQLSSSGRRSKSAANGAVAKGAPRWIVTATPEQKAVAEKEWFSRNHSTDDERMAAIQDKLGKKDAPSRTTMRKYFGSPYATKT